MKPSDANDAKLGAGEGIRTLDPNLGKVKVGRFPLLPRNYRRLLCVEIS